MDLNKTLHLVTKKQKRNKQNCSACFVPVLCAVCFKSGQTIVTYLCPNYVSM